MNWKNAAPDKWVGPHTDQSARDRIDDHGLVVTEGVTVGAALQMEATR